jgi:hypothetical protein
MNRNFLPSVALAVGLAVVPMTSADAAVAWGVNLASAEFGSESAMPGTHGQQYIYPNAPGTPDSLGYYAGKNLKLVRLPIRWERIQKSLNGSLDSGELARVNSFVDAANAKGMRVILDIHNYCAYYQNGTRKALGTTALTQEHLADLWRRLATELRNKPNIFGYDLMNEPVGLGSNGPTIWKNAAQAAITSIRTVDTNTTIIVSGYDWSSAVRWTQTNNDLRLLSDPSNKLVFQAHQYFDNNESGTYKVNNADNYDFQAHTGGDLDRGAKLLDPFIVWLRQHNLKGLIGETSIPGNNNANWNTAFARYLQKIKDSSDVLVGFTYWAGGPWWPTSKPEWSHMQPYNQTSFPTEPAKWTDRPQMTVYMAATGGLAEYQGAAAAPDTVTTLTAPSTAAPGASINLSIAYDAATANRRLAVMLFSVNAAGTWIYQAGTFPTVSGKGTLNTTLAVPATTPLGSAIWVAQLQSTPANTTLSTAQKPVTIQAAGPSQTPYAGAIAIPGVLQAENFDNGGPGVAYYDTTPTNLFSGFRQNEGVDASTSGAVGYTADGEWMEYTVQVAATATYDVTARVGVAKKSATISLSVDGALRLDRRPLSRTGDYGVLQSRALGSISLTAGTHVIRVTIPKAGYNLDSLTFTAVPAGNG